MLKNLSTTFVVFFLLLCPAIAADAGKPADTGRVIDMTTVLLDAKGKPLPNPSGQTSEDPRCTKCDPLRLGDVVAYALFADGPRQDRVPLSSIEKARRGALALRVMDDPKAKLTAADLDMIVKSLDVWAPLVVVRAIALLDPNALDPK